MDSQSTSSNPNLELTNLNDLPPLPILLPTRQNAERITDLNDLPLLPILLPTRQNAERSIVPLENTKKRKHFT